MLKMKFTENKFDKDTYVIAEIGNNHEGNVNLAEDMIGLAASSGADAVKFQMIRPEMFVSSSDKDRFNQLKRFELSLENYERFYAFSKKMNLDFLTTPFDLDAVDILMPWVPAFKVASSDNNFYPLLKKIALTTKPIILSTGLAEEEELRKSVQFIEDIWEGNKISSKLIILHCVTSYPTPNEQANLRTITYLMNIFPKHIVGYSDHTLGVDACVAAVALGAKVIEKHFTLNHNHSSFRDHQLSADPVEFKDMVTRIKETHLMLGEYKKVVTASESDVKARLRRSIAFKHPLVKGHKIELKDLIWVRPGTGIAPGDEQLIVGKSLNVNVERGDIINLEMLKD
jgi:sialic acid synthase SpsE